MNYTIICKWNGLTVLKGKSTMVMAYDTAKGFLGGNFAGARHAAFMQDVSLDGLRKDLETARRWERRFGDTTGCAHVVIMSNEA